MGLKAPEPIKPSFTASYILGAFNIISRSRRYIEAIPLDLSLQDIQAYFEVYGCDIETVVFVESIFALDDKFLKDARTTK
ncbi:hypothetical protein [Acinetobacter pollinis]|uniref:hypothetical protein n=1 Tax=Acinetobacter pollinis TaxID=2605270 RepID=UPI0018A25DFE|nr:hypothetical protein [Acinetobacter pollinis]MBF7690673.1 hypothetical protein [Acinetobacter pollinis]MBF7698603.1 hypothetical protein [Acinetobacter pollinis]